MNESRPSVLLVDDETLVTRLYGRAIESMGFRPRYAENGLAALEELERETPVLIITDLNMPGLSGLGLTENLTRNQSKPCPIIMASGDDEMPVVLNGLAAGVDDFLVKGMPFGLFMERIRFWTGGPFRFLPDYIRNTAIESIKRVEPASSPVHRLRGRIDLLIDRAYAVVADQVMECPPEFGEDPRNRVRFLGLLDQVLAILSRSSGLAHLRRPDAMVDVIRRLRVGWAEAVLAEDMPRLSALHEDTAFIHAAETLTLRV